MVEICITLQLGSTGNQVKLLQSTLIQKGYNPGPVDGDFGTITKLSVIQYQTDNGLYIDGVVGNETWTALGITDCTYPPVTENSLLKYEPYELLFTTSNSYGNPYISVNLSVTFTGPNNTIINIDGFWDGDNVYKIRMSPIVSGIWNYITSSNDSQLNGITGTFNIEESTNKGFIKVNTINPYSFMYDDGTPFFWMGDTLWIDPGYTNFVQYIDKLSENGYNTYHNVITNKNNAINEAGYSFEENTPSTEIKNYDRIRPDYFKEYDKRVAYANSKNIIPQLYFAWSQDFAWFTRAQFERYAKYIVARYSAFNVIWIIAAEYNETSTPSEYAYHGNIIYQKDPYKHPLSIHPTGSSSNTDFSASTWNTCILQQNGFNFPLETNQYILTDRIYNKPVINSEAHYLYDGEITIENWRKQNWLIAIAGGYFDTGYQNLFWYGLGSFDLNIPNNVTGMTQMKHLSNFFKTTQFWKMSPKNNLVSSGYLLGTNQLGKEYIIYLLNGGSTNVDLSSSPETLYTIWFNPRTGQYQGKTSIQGGTIISFTAPDSNDWILHIYACIRSVCDFTIK